MRGGSNEGRSDASFSQRHPCNYDAAPSLRCALQPEAPEDTGSTRQAEGEGASSSDHFLHQRRVDVKDVHPRSDTGPSIGGEGKLAVVHFMINWRKHCIRRPERRLVTLTDSDQPMVILLAMATGKVSAVHTSGNPGVETTLTRVV